MPFWWYMRMLLFGKKVVTWPPECFWSNMMIKSFDSWRQSICPLRFQFPTVKDTKLGAWKWHEGIKPPIRKLRAALQNKDLTGVSTLVPQTNLPETPSCTEGETLKSKSEIFQEGHMEWLQRRNSFFCLRTSSGSWLTPYMPPLI